MGPASVACQVPVHHHLWNNTHHPTDPSDKREIISHSQHASVLNPDRGEHVHVHCSEALLNKKAITPCVTHMSQPIHLIGWVYMCVYGTLHFPHTLSTDTNNHTQNALSHNPKPAFLRPHEIHPVPQSAFLLLSQQAGIQSCSHFHEPPHSRSCTDLTRIPWIPHPTKKKKWPEERLTHSPQASTSLLSSSSSSRSTPCYSESEDPGSLSVGVFHIFGLC